MGQSIADLTAEGQRPGGATRAVLLWAATAFAFWPVLFDLFQHMLRRGWPAYGLLFVVPFAFSARAQGFVGPRCRNGYVLLTLSLVLEVVLSQGGFTRMARVAIPLALLGSCRAFGLTSTRTALLGIWFVPVPSMLNQSFASHGALDALMSIGVTAISPLAPIDAMGMELNGPTASLTLSHVDAGLPLVALLSGLAWYTASREQLSWRSTLIRVFGWGGLGLPLQAIIVLWACLGVAMGHPTAARFALEGGVAVATAAALLWRSRWWRPIQSGASQEPQQLDG